MLFERGNCGPFMEEGGELTNKEREGGEMVEILFRGSAGTREGEEQYV